MRYSDYSRLGLIDDSGLEITCCSIGLALATEPQSHRAILARAFQVDRRIEQVKEGQCSTDIGTLCPLRVMTKIHKVSQRGSSGGGLLQLPTRDCAG